MAAPIGVLTNPNSGKNRRKPGRRAELERAAGRRGIVRETHDLAELEHVVDELFEADCGYWVCDGGDGTLHWLLSIAHRRARDRHATVPKIVPANGGSIDFVAHKAGIRGKAPDVLRALVQHLERGEAPPTIELDTMDVSVTRQDQPDAAPMRQIGFAAAIGGVAQRFFDKLYQRERVGPWGIVDVLARSAAGAVASTAPRPIDGFLAPGLRRYADDMFNPTRARVDVDGAQLTFESFSSLQVGAIDISLGGVVRTFRHAAESGVLHAQAISTTRLGVVANIPNIVMGTPIWGKNVYDGPAAHVRVEALGDEPLGPVIDGELFPGIQSIEVARGPKLEVAAVCTA